MRNLLHFETDTLPWDKYMRLTCTELGLVGNTEAFEFLERFLGSLVHTRSANMD